MKKLSILIIFLLLFPLAHAQEENYNTYSELEISFTLDSEVKARPTKPNPTLESLIANLSLFPRDDSMTEIIDIDTSASPNAEITQLNNEILYTWEHQTTGTFSYSLDSTVKTINRIYQVYPQKFPILDLDPNLEKYTEATEMIDINQDIIDQANEIVSGEKDLFTAVYNTAEWTRENIPYDLNTLTADAVQKSSWVMENRQGVCDEITGLFISLLRSVGVPARFVSGMVYSNVNEDFGAHGWAEVYFPETGWVPFDPTFGQYGWIDPSHVKLTDSPDSGSPSVRYTWRSNGVEIETEPLDLSSSIISTGDQIDPRYDLNVEPLVDKVKTGSYVPIKVSVENPQSYYSSTTAIITIAPEIFGERVNRNIKHLLLRPLEHTTVFWIVKLPDEGLQDYVYTTKVKVIDTFGSSDSINIEYANNYEIFTLKQAQDLVDELEEQQEKTFSDQLSLKCEPKKPYYYTYEDAYIECSLTNIGNTFLSNIELCFKEDCKRTDLRIGEKKFFEFSKKVSSLSPTPLVTAKNSQVEVNSFLNLRVLREPDLKVESIDYPKQVDYNQPLTITFDLDSDVIVKDLEIKIDNLDPLIVEQSQGTKTIKLETNSNHFINNRLDIKVDYKDENGKEYQLTETFDILVTNLPWYARILRVFKLLIAKI